MWVIEAKAGAPLKKQQNPAEPEFLEENHGYGALAAAAEAAKGKKLRYIVLGAKSDPRIRDGQKKGGSSVQQRSWDQLREGVTPKGIVKDLIDTFAELRIGDFYMEKARAFVVTGGIQDAVKAWVVLDAIGEEYLKVPEGKRRHQAGINEDGIGWFGYYVRQPRKRVSGNYLKLRSATRKSGELAWFGYECNAAGKGSKVVWFYLDDEKKRDSLKRKLLSNGFTAEPGQDDDGPCYVAISSPLKHSGKDLEWFQSVVDCAIKT
jgi:hypothetical protein